jgi:hypothetical protein
MNDSSPLSLKGALAIARAVVSSDRVHRRCTGSPNFSSRGFLAVVFTRHPGLTQQSLSAYRKWFQRHSGAASGASSLLRFFHGIGYWLASVIIGGLALTLVYMFVVVPLKTGTLPSNMGGLFIISFILNAAWGIGWALLVLMVFFGLQWNLEPTQNSPAGRSEWVCPDAFRSLVAL